MLLSSKINHAETLPDHNQILNLKHIMPNSNSLYEDMEKLNALYEELCWAHDDELVFTHENGRVIIYNKTLEEKNERKSRTH